MHPLLAVVLLMPGLLVFVFSQNGPTNWTASPFNPPALPLAVRSPYLNVWIPQGNDPLEAYNVNNYFWDYSDVVQWYASVVVDDSEHVMLSPWAQGEPLANQTSVEFTATRTSFLMTAGAVQVNMSFLSPIEPNNFTAQSLPFAYLYMTAESMDGQPHRVLMYSDIEGIIAAGDIDETLVWSGEDSDDYVVLSTQLQNQKPFVETDVQAQDSTVYYSFKKIPNSNTSWSITGFNAARGVFFADPTSGTLNDQADSDFRSPDSGNDTPVFGIAIDWGNITSTPEPAVWCLGVYRDPSIQYLTPEGSFQTRSPYFASTISDPLDAPKRFLDDFPRALSVAEALDAQIQSDGETISSEYAELLVLSVRQAMGAMDITIPSSNDGSWDTSDVKIFMKNIGSVGSDYEASPSINNVDALYAAFPAFLYLNPDIGGYLLAPLLEFQDSDAYELPYAARNIGTNYSSAIANGINEQHTFGVDETAGMIIMTLAYSLASGNGTLIANHYDLLSSWAGYLSNNTVTPSNQSSGDFSNDPDFIKANQTNLALKGIIGIAAMAKIAEAFGETDDAQRFQTIATSAIELWQSETISSSSNINFYYGQTNTSGLLYNLYADKLLRLDFVPDSVYTACTTYYQDVSGQMTYGIPLDNSPSQNTTTNWMMFAAATVKSNATRDIMISQVHAYASNNLNNGSFTSIYNPSTGRTGLGSKTGRASPAQGGLFALLALNTTSKTIDFSGAISTSAVGLPNSRKVNAGVIAGATVAGIAVVCGMALGIFFYKRRTPEKRRKNNETPAGQDTYSYTAITGDSAQESYETPRARHSRSDDLTRYVNQQRRGKDQPVLEAAVDNSRLARLMARIRELESRDGVSTASNSDRLQAVESLRSELDSLRREVEQLRQERSEDAPPSYSDPF